MGLKTAYWVVLTALGLLPAAGLAIPGDDSRIEARLKSIQEQIHNVREGVSASRSRLDTLQAELRDLETELGDIRARLHAVEVDRTGLASIQEGLQVHQQKLEASLEEDRRALSAHVRAAYLMGGQERLKVLFGDVDPSAAGRDSYYLEYLLQDRSAQVRRLLEKIEQIASTERRQAQNQRRLDALGRTLEEGRKRLEAALSERRDTLAAVAGEIDDQEARLEQLLQEKQDLSGLLDALREALKDVPERSGGVEAFSEDRGQLSWPTRGRVQELYGKVRKGTRGKLKWQGVLIQARRDEGVFAISYGRVVFADWMRGYGLLLILDHGNGFMSLYGHNQVIFHAPGDWVDAGELIARVGDTGGQDRPALYFEIRRDGKAMDPARWCSGFPETASTGP